MEHSGLEEPGKQPQAKSLPKVPTHIKGLDEILNGGLPQGRTALVSGEPGSGKTVLGLEILYRAAMNGEPGILLSFEESPQALRQNAAHWALTCPLWSRPGNSYCWRVEQTTGPRWRGNSAWSP